MGSGRLQNSWKRFIACRFFGFASFRHLNDRDMKESSHRGGGGGEAGVPWTRHLSHYTNTVLSLLLS